MLWLDPQHIPGHGMFLFGGNILHWFQGCGVQLNLLLWKGTFHAELG